MCRVCWDPSSTISKEPQVSLYHANRAIRLLSYTMSIRNIRSAGLMIQCGIVHSRSNTFWGICVRQPQLVCGKMRIISDLYLKHSVRITFISSPAKMRRWPNVGLLLGQRRRRWANSKPTLFQRLKIAWRLFQLIQYYSRSYNKELSSNAAQVRIA